MLFAAVFTLPESNRIYLRDLKRPYFLADLDFIMANVKTNFLELVNDSTLTLDPS